MSQTKAQLIAGNSDQTIAASTVTATNIKNPSSVSNNIVLSSNGAATINSISTTNLKNPSAANNNVVLNSDGSIGGTFLASTSDVGGIYTTGSITSGTPTLTVASATGITSGMHVVGQGISPGTTVNNVVGTTITLSANSSATFSSAPVSFYVANKVLSPATVGGMLCCAWVNFNGTGTVAIRAQYNVSSITDLGVGSYQINFTSSFSDANFAVIATCSTEPGSVGIVSSGPSDTDFGKTINRVNLYTYDSSSESVVDRTSVNVSVFR